MCWLIILCRFHWHGQNCTWLSCWSRSVLICLTTDSQLLVMAAGTTFGRQHVMGRSLCWTMCRDQPLYTVGSSLRSVATAHVGVLLLQQIFVMSFDSKYHTLFHLVSWQPPWALSLWHTAEHGSSGSTCLNPGIMLITSLTGIVLLVAISAISQIATTDKTCDGFALVIYFKLSKISNNCYNFMS